jgi:hypothetical protein
MITSGAVSAPHLPHHRRVTLQTRRTARLCRSPGGYAAAQFRNFHRRASRAAGRGGCIRGPNEILLEGGFSQDVNSAELLITSPNPAT